MKYKKPKFCGQCGTKMVEEPTGTFDLQTGKKETFPKCPNLSCRAGCRAVSHKGAETRREWFGLFPVGKVCLRCGGFIG